jgi:2-polyprenyl-6-methoxyphenol hydroxylase-like FAD-dependent oxidoreductase
VVRSEADELLFKHAGECGVHTFDETKVASIEFSKTESSDGKLGRPKSATWTRKDGSSGTIMLDYLVDASGRAGLISTKYLKNRHFNQGLKNVASWSYWKGGGVYGVGSYKEGAPYFEALKDASGWAWFIPLHNGTHSVGIVQNQEMATKKKREMVDSSSKGFYFASMEFVPGIKELLKNAENVSEVKSASDWSYSASSYASPGIRVAGDAGSFIDPFFSSGVHLALSGGLSAATTIAAAIRGDCDEETAAAWHDKKTAESYTRFLVVVSSALKQIRSSDQPVIHDFDEESFERAFDLFRPIIQGQADADMKGNLTQSEISKTLEFCFKAFAHVPFEEKEALVAKLKKLGLDGDAYDESNRKQLDEFEKKLTPEEQSILKTLKGRRMVRPEDSLNIDNFTLDSIDGLAPRMERGQLGLTAARKAEVKFTTHDKLSFLNGEAKAGKAMQNGHAKLNGDSVTNGDHTSTNGDHPATNGHHPVNGHHKAETSMSNTSSMANLMTAEKSSPSATLDELSRHRLMSSLREQAEELETPYDTMVRFVDSGRQIALIKLGGDLGIFKSLAESKTPLSSEQLAKPNDASPLLVSRIVRYLVANRLVGEVAPDRYVARKATYTFASPGIESPMRFFHAVSNPAFQVLPDFLKDTGYQNQVQACAVQKGLDTDLGLFPWLKQHPSLLKDFQNLMGVPREGPGSGIDAITLDVTTDGANDSPVLVDIGGNVGQQARRVLARYPELAGRLLVQDRDETIKSASGAKGIQFMAHDFFAPQPVKGAKYYYLRAVLHNWDDDKAAQILANIVPAMSAESRVLIDEVIIPDMGAHIWPAGLDLQMFTLFGAFERTASQWDALLQRAGLRPVAVEKYAPVMGGSVIFAAPR